MCRQDEEKQGEKMKRTNQGHGAVCPLPPSAGYSLPWLAALARRGDELRVKKVQRIKKQLAQGIYHVKATEVVRGIARSEISWLLGLEPVRSHEAP